MIANLNKIGDSISKAIKEGKWLHISFVNKKKETTYFWVAIQDINISTQQIKIKMFNHNISPEARPAWIDFNSITSAKVIDFSTYDVQVKLIEKIERNLHKCQWLNYDRFNHNILNYYEECSLLNNDPFQSKYSFISGIDLQAFFRAPNRKYILSDDQMYQIIRDIYNYDINKNDNFFYTLAMNKLSIDQDKKKYVVAYYEVRFNPADKTLVLDKTARFNESFLVEGRKHSLSKYINMNVDDFISDFEKNEKDCIEIIRHNCVSGEKINTRPEIMLLQRELSVNLTDSYEMIQQKHDLNELSIPLKSFFGNISKRNNIRKKEPSLIISSKKINIDQIRVLYNATKYPVTYVQGPPGTGKTETILNVILSSFFNEKTVLVCSYNNKPIDGIVDKLNFNSRYGKIPFPYLRLGNINDVKKATLRIRELYQFETKREPRNHLLEKIKITTDENNAKLINLLNTQEKRIEFETCIEISKKLINSFKDKSSGIIDPILNKIAQLNDELEKLPIITNKDLLPLFDPLDTNAQLQQYLYFKSLQLINMLKKPRYKKLIDVCFIEDEDKRAQEFNKWTENNENMKLLNDAFPIILSTNISARRLGTPSYMFDLVIMDEAGQCDVATALIPVSKATSLLLVGDSKQLKPVIILEHKVNEQLKKKFHIADQYDYKTNSILSVMRANDNISKHILLRYHYRCGKKIINFSNQRYYNNELDLSESQKTDGCIEVLNVKNQNVRNRNEAIDEIDAIIEYIKRNEIKDAFIITPFVNQKLALEQQIEKCNIQGVECGTIHSVQGAQNSTIILSTAISHKTSKKTYEWLKNNYEIINVATTRAVDKLVVVADTEIIEKFSDTTDDFYNLISYAKSNGTTTVPMNESIKIEQGYSNASKAEDEFFATVSHFCSCHQYFQIERNVKVSKLFKTDPLLSASKREFDAVLYAGPSKMKVPKIAFEIHGGEHLGTISRELSDKEKINICKKHNIKLIFIPNDFVKAYEYIKEIIFSAMNNKNISQQLMFDYGE